MLPFGIRSIGVAPIRSNVNRQLIVWRRTQPPPLLLREMFALTKLVTHPETMARTNLPISPALRLLVLGDLSRRRTRVRLMADRMGRVVLGQIRSGRTTSVAQRERTARMNLLIPPP